MNKVLIITNKEDVTVDFIIDQLLKKDVYYYRFNTEEIGHEIDIDFSPLINNFKIIDNTSQAEIDLSIFDSVYYRRPKIPPVPKEISEGESIFFINEFSILLDGIYHYLNDKQWLNNVFDIRRAENKINQLSVAHNLGLKIPHTRITNIAQVADKFISSHPKTIFKPLKHGFIEEPKEKSKIIYTNDVDENFKCNLERIKILPTYFQRKIEKSYDVRVTVVGDKIFAAQIDSQLLLESTTDWRATNNVLPHEAIQLPKDIENKCIELTKHYQLNFAAIDLIHDKRNEYYFLEINPNGQWAWIEQLLDYPISEAITEILVGI